MPKPLAHALAKDLSKQSNYIHWTCYRQEPTLPTEKLQCCQEIYQTQEQDPFHLCWKKNGCQRDKLGRSEFMHYCTEQIVSLENILPRMSPHQSVEPRFSLLLAPLLSDLPSEQWRQLVSLDSNKPGQWVYQVESPFRLAIDPGSFVTPEGMDDATKQYPSTGAFDAKLTSEILPHPDEEDDFRDIQNTLEITLPSEETTSEKQEKWTVSLEIVLHLPEDVALRQTKASNTCQSSQGECQLQIDKGINNSVDQQRLVHVHVTVSDITKSTNHVPTSVVWRNSIALEQDNIILPAPFILGGTATNDASNLSLTWKPTTMDKVALPTSLDSNDEL
jgi:hypothetical protein